LSHFEEFNREVEKDMRKLFSLGMAFLILASLAVACSGPEEKKMKFFNKGKSLYEKGEFVKAGLEFRNAIQIDPKYADAHYMLGMVELRKGNLKNAYGSFSKAVELNPNLTDAHIQLGNLYLAARQPDKALKKAETVLQLSPGNEDALLLKAAALIALKDSADALAILRDMRQRGVKRPELFLLLASSHLQNNSIKEAQDALNTGIADNPKAVILYLTLADLYTRDKKIDEAAATLQKVIALEPKNSRYRLTLAGLYWHVGQNDKAVATLQEVVAAEPANEEGRLQVGGFYIARGRFADAERELKAGIQAIPKSFKLRFALSDLYLNTGMPDRAISLLNECLALEKDAGNPQILQTKNALARIHLARQEVKEASRYVDEVIKENSKDVDAHFTKGNIALLKRDGAGAVAEFRTVTSERPQLIPGHIRLAEAHMLNKEYNLASDTLEKALKANPRSAPLLSAPLVQVYMKQKKYESALALLEERIQQNPGDAFALNLRGQVYNAQGDELKAAESYRQAMAVYEKVLQKQPENWVAANDLAFLLSEYGSKPGDLDRALALARKAYGRNAENPAVLDTLGWIYYKKGDYRQAEALIVKAINKAPESVMLNYHLGMIQLKTGQAEQGKQRLNFAVRSGEGFAGRPDALKALGMQ